jgi:hypothetical protein
MTAAARAANPSSDAYWERNVDPDALLSEQERRTRAKDAKRAHFARLALKSRQARRRRAGTAPETSATADQIDHADSAVPLLVQDLAVIDDIARLVAS